MIYVLILLAKILEISMGTFRNVMIIKGERAIGTIIGFFEVLIWLLVVSSVLTNIKEDPIKLIVYSLGFAIGLYVGSKIEESIAIGNVRVEAIVAADYDMADKLRKSGYGVTVVDAHGMNYERQMLILNIRRKIAPKAVETIRSLDKEAVITIYDIRAVNGGYGLIRK